MSPRLTNYMALVAALHELDIWMDEYSHTDPDGSWEENTKGMHIVLCYLLLVHSRHWPGKDLGWPLHLEKMRTLYNKYIGIQVVSDKWELANDLPEDELLVTLANRINAEIKDAVSLIETSRPVWIEVVQENIHILTRDHLKKIH